MKSTAALGPCSIQHAFIHNSIKNILPVAVHVQQPKENDENEGRKDRNEDPH